MDFSDYMAYVESGRCESDYWKKELKDKKRKRINEEEGKMWKQIKFRVTNPELMDDNSDNIFGGIAEMVEDMIDGELVPIRIICGCYGSEFEPSDVKILECYDDWMNLTDAIVGN